MFTDYLLGKHAARLTRRYLTIEESLSCSAPEPDKERSYLLYIHVPFCEELCPFCAFMRVKYDSELAMRYFVALKKEIELFHKRGFRFDSIYVGGGTPTILPDKLSEIIGFVKSLWPISQISLETNPNHLVPEILDILQEIGVNRLSVGVQSFDNGILKSVERFEKYGSGEEIKEWLSSIVGVFDTLNVDMMFNFPNQTDEILAREIEIVKEIKAEQITWYPLMVSEFRRKEMSKRCGKVDFRREKRFYEMLCEGLSDSYNQESVWCFTNKTGLIDEYPIEHDEYAGAGPGSMGYINGTLSFNTFSIPRYIEMVEGGEIPVTAMREFSGVEQLRYRLLMELLSGSMDLGQMKEKHGKFFWVKLLCEFTVLYLTGSATFGDGKITLTPRGKYYWLTIMRTLFSTLGDYRDRRISVENRQEEEVVAL